jgi:hypothetical protein
MDYLDRSRMGTSGVQIQAQCFLRPGQDPVYIAAVRLHLCVLNSVNGLGTALCTVGLMIRSQRRQWNAMQNEECIISIRHSYAAAIVGANVAVGGPWNIPLISVKGAHAATYRN